MNAELVSLILAFLSEISFGVAFTITIVKMLANMLWGTPYYDMYFWVCIILFLFAFVCFELSLKKGSD
jgi:hypothetical protein